MIQTAVPAALPPAPTPAPAVARTGALQRAEARVLEAFGASSIARLLAVWGGVTLAFGLLYWALAVAGAQGLRRGDTFVAPGLAGLADAVYFSFVTSLTIGYGDIVPIGAFRPLALLQGAAGYLLFGAVIAKLVSRRQEALTEEIHEIAFEEQLDRVRTSLHLVLTELQTLAEFQAIARLPQDRILQRLESTAVVFHGELRTVHELLYRPYRRPDEDTLESILVILHAVLRELEDLLARLPDASASSPLLARTLHASGGLAQAVCGECVPREFAPQLREWMDRVSAQGRAMERR